MAASTTPAYSDILVVIFLALILIFLCAILLHISSKWSSILKKRIELAKERRRFHNDKFREENGYSWDYVFAFKVYEEDEVVSDDQQKYNMKYVLAHLAMGGIETRLSYSVQHTMVFCKLRAPIARLLIEVDRVDYTLPTNAEALERVCTTGRKDYWGPLQIPISDSTGQTNIGPYDYVYLKYNYIAPEVKATIAAKGDDGRLFLEWQDTLSTLYKRWPSSISRMETDSSDLSTVNPINAESGQRVFAAETLLRGVDRLKIIRSILT